MSSTTLSMIIGLPASISYLLAARYPLFGFAVSISIQPFWYAFYWSTGGYWLLPASTIFFIGGILHLRTHLRARGLTLAGFPRYATAETIAAFRLLRSLTAADVAAGATRAVAAARTMITMRRRRDIAV